MQPVKYKSMASPSTQSYHTNNHQVLPRAGPAVWPNMIHQRLGCIQDILQHQSLYDIGYQRAADYLQQLREKTHETLQSALKTAECELRLRRGKEVESIKRVRKILERFGANDAECVLGIGEKYDKGDNRQRVQALVLYNIAHQMHLECHHTLEPNDVATWIVRLVHDVRLAAYNLSDEIGESSKIIAINYGAKLATSLLNTLRKIDISERLERRERAVCMYHLADIYFRAEDYRTSVRLLKDATRLFNGLSCENEYDHERYCLALWTLGNCYYRLKDFAKAEEQYEITKAEVKRLPATAAKLLKISSEDLAKAFLQQGKEPPELEIFGYDVHGDNFRQYIAICEDQNTLDSLLEIASLELLLQRGREDRSMRRVERKVEADSSHTAASVLKKSEQCDERYVEQRIKALILYRISHELFRKERHSADETVEWIQNLVQVIRLTAYDLAALKGVPCIISINHGAKYAELLLHFLFRIANATPSLLLMAIARCLYHIANIYFRAGEYERSLLFFQRYELYFGVVFPKTPHKFQRYCLALWNIGNCYFRLRRFNDAAARYGDAVSGIERSSQAIQQRWLKIAKRDFAKAVAQRV